MDPPGFIISLTGGEDVGSYGNGSECGMVTGITIPNRCVTLFSFLWLCPAVMAKQAVLGFKKSSCELLGTAESNSGAGTSGSWSFL